MQFNLMFFQMYGFQYDTILFNEFQNLKSFDAARGARANYIIL